MKLSDLPADLVVKMNGLRPSDDFESDGCTSVWDYWFGVDCTPACHWHDWAYSLGGCKKKRYQADALFFRNLRSCDLSKLIANIRYLGVRFYGCWFFAYTKQSHKWSERLQSVLVSVCLAAAVAAVCWWGR